MNIINWQSKDSKKNVRGTEQGTDAMNIVVDRRYFEELQIYAELGMRSNQQLQEQLALQRKLQEENCRLQTEAKQHQEALEYQKKLQEENRRLQAEVKHHRKTLEYQEKLREENYRLQAEIKQYQEKLKSQKKYQENEDYRKKIEQEQELRKQAEFKLRVTKQELQEELKRRETRGMVPQSPQKLPQFSEIKAADETVDNKKKIQRELSECSKAIREIQHMIKEAYQFEPCRQLCELLVNIRQKVYTEVESIQEDMICVIEAFGIKEYGAASGDAFDPKYHEQIHSSVTDVKGKKVKEIFSMGFEMDGEVIMKAQVSIGEPGTGGGNE